jgi:hypothetical protein
VNAWRSIPLSGHEELSAEGQAPPHPQQSVRAVGVLICLLGATHTLGGLVVLGRCPHLPIEHRVLTKRSLQIS